MSFSRLDQVYRRILMTKFFTKGWGKPENIKRLFEFKKIVSNRESCLKLVPADYPITITKEETFSDCKIIEGQFVSPVQVHLPGIMPQESETAYFQIILPKKWSSDHYKPICLHLAGTGDHGFWRRRQLMAKPLIKQSEIAAILLENPFYGLRKPKDQVRSNLHNVSDIIVMGACLILESLALFHWCERVGLGPLGITGLSMGGHMASLAATNWPKPIALVPCLSWSTASLVFTEGVMSGAINWPLLEEQYFSGGYQHDIDKMINIDENAFRAGRQFVKNYPESMDRLKELQQDRNSHHNVSSGSVDSTTIQDTNSSPTPKPKNNKVDDNNNVDSNLSSNQEKLTEDSIIKRLSLLNMFNPEKSTKRNLSELNLSKSKLLNFNRQASEAQLRTKSREREALQFMRGIMDEYTHLSNFEVPIDTSLIIAICAKDDAYVPRKGTASLTEIWPGAEVRFLNSGHVGAFLLHQHIFREAIIESFERMEKKYPHSSQREKGRH